MRLLIFTQVVDSEHPVLGFFISWINAFAKRYEHVHVIALQVGSYTLPDNVTVHSLGKETGENRLKYIRRFYALIWQLRHEYEQVFVHMNQVYVILGSLLWRLWGKKIGLWYAHGAVTPSLYVSVLLSHIVFTSTPQGMRVKTAKRAVVGQGIDPEQFTLSQRTSSDSLRLITIGRVSPSKNIDTLLRAAALLKEQQIKFSLRIIGGTSTEAEVAYARDMEQLVRELSLQTEVVWVGPLPHDALPNELAQSDLFIHDGSTNSLDKTLVEASFAGCVVISSNPSYRGLTESIAPELLFAPKDFVALAQKIKEHSQEASDAPEKVRSALLESCSLPGLISGIVSRY